MANYFDQFDEPAQGPRRAPRGGGNYFDKFDDEKPTAAPSRRMNALAAAGYGALDAASFGWADELAGLVNEDWKYGLRDQMGRARDEQGGAYLAGQIGGSIALPGAALKVLGKAPAAAALFRGTASLPMPAQMAIGGAVGGVSGAIGGAGRADNTDRLSGAASGAAAGTAFGAAAPVLGAAVGKVLGSTRMGPTQVAKMAAAGDIPAQGPNPVDISALDDFIRTMERSGRRTTDDLTTYLDEAAADPNRGRTWMDAFGQAGVKRMKALYKMPGQTADQAADQFGARAAGQRGRIEKALLGRAGMSSLDAEKEVARLYDEVGDEFYRPVLNQNLSPRQMQAFEDQVMPLTRNHWFGKALEKGDELLANDILLGKQPATAGASLAHRLHYTKLAFDAKITQLKRSSDLNAAAGTELRQLIEIKNKFLKILDPHNPLDPLSSPGGGILPGYSVARREFGGIVEADDAIENGRAIFRSGTFRTPEHLQEYVQKLSGFEKKFFLAGVEDELQRILSNANTAGRRNLAAELLNDGRMDRLKAVFPDSVVRRIEQTLRAEDELFRTGSAARSGSDTATALGEFAEQVSAMQGSPPLTIPGLMAKAWDQTGGAINRAVNARAIEGRANELGRLLLTQIDDPNTTPQMRAFLEQVAFRQAQRELAQRTMFGAGVSAGMTGAPAIQTLSGGF
jgi:hypothetical protein